MTALVAERLVMDLPLHGRHAHPDGPDVASRDRHTLTRLLGAVPGEVTLLGYDRLWWDGRARSACALVVVDGTRCRLVETQGQVLVLARSARRARRQLARYRLGMEPSERPVPGAPLVIEQDADARRCPGGDCGAMLVVPAPGQPLPDGGCPICGRR